MVMKLVKSRWVVVVRIGKTRHLWIKETYVGSCASTSCNFCCGVTAMGPDGVMKNYGPHCREGQCGNGGNASKMEQEGKDQKNSWTDCDT